MWRREGIPMSSGITDGSLELGCEVDRPCERIDSTRSGTGAVDRTASSSWAPGSARRSNWVVRRSRCGGGGRVR